MFHLLLRIYSLHLLLFRVTLQHDPDLLFNPAKNAIYAGGLIRLKSGYSDCWLDLKRKRYPGRYPDGGVCGRRYIGGCTPVYPDKINPYLVKDLTTLDDFVLYEPDGPLFEVVPPGQEDNELNTGFDDQFFSNNSVIQLVMDKANVERLEVTNFRAPVQKSLYQISSQYDETFLRKEADWRIILIQDSSQNSTHSNGDIWRPGHKFQLFNVEMQAYLGVTGNLMPDYLDSNLKEIGGYPAANMTHSDYIKTVWTVDKIRMRVDYETIIENRFRKFYGDGRDPDTLPNTLILSFEDIQVCFAKELDVIKQILNSEGKNNFIKLLSEYKIELDTITQSDMSHPVDIFNLYKRVSIFWKEVHQTYNNDDTRKVLDSFLEKFHKEWIYYGRMSAVGLLNIQMYHDLDPRDIINGIIYYGDKTYKSKSKLAIDDVKLIANAAKQDGRLNLYVRWLQSVPELHNEYLIAAADHDDALANWEHTLTNGIRTLTYPIHNNASEAAKSFREMFEQQMNMVCENPKITHTCKYQFQFEKIQKLCKEPGHSSAPRPENICSHINYQDPYLKLGPFRLEHLNTEPAVEVFHNIIHDDEIKWMKDMSRDYMATAQLTTFSTEEQEEDPGNFRAKQAYFETTGQLKILTNRLELATTLKIHNPNYRYNSWNYQLVDFGMGGVTEIHLDEPKLPSVQAFSDGGGFAATNILYLSNNVVGGKTVFPDAGVGVYPEAGAILYFSIKTTTMNADYRMSHLGCPAAYGNKFITNKLVRIVENMNRLPCYADLNNKLFPPNHYHITYDNILYQKDILTA